MEALKLIKTVSGDSLYIDGLNQFNGQEVEVIILPSSVEPKEATGSKRERVLNLLKEQTKSTSLPIPTNYKFNRDEIYEE